MLDTFGNSKMQTWRYILTNLIDPRMDFVQRQIHARNPTSILLLPYSGHLLQGKPNLEDSGSFLQWPYPLNWTHTGGEDWVCLQTIGKMMITHQNELIPCPFTSQHIATSISYLHSMEILWNLCRFNMSAQDNLVSTTTSEVLQPPVVVSTLNAWGSSQDCPRKAGFSKTWKSARNRPGSLQHFEGTNSQQKHRWLYPVLKISADSPQRTKQSMSGVICFNHAKPWEFIIYMRIS